MTSFLDNLSILNSFTQEERDNLSLFCQEKYIQKWDIIFEENEYANSMYLLVKWRVQIYQMDWIAKKVLWEIVAEEFLWEMAILWESEKRMAAARALEDSTLIVILSFSIKELLNKHPELKEKIEQIIKQRREENRKIGIIL